MQELHGFVRMVAYLPLICHLMRPKIALCCWRKDDDYEGVAVGPGLLRNAAGGVRFSGVRETFEDL